MANWISGGEGYSGGGRGGLGLQSAGSGCRLVGGTVSKVTDPESGRFALLYSTVTMMYSQSTHFLL